ncbi:MarR family winged helix-turn-helix transcriptional regulator [Arthrobacter tumbae]|uniref:MarR family winged helix-turn-helix transcriptional regulator n=1 Tax=Arthrobacter tumbae TaxID=163874 RepID=UPI001958B3E0|nr:MarR family transcriptional regulator [Arthrobacter tumbae]MBM7782166.1 DNA-binding MarR family transcriptional regulator [Arthrobacter tumbae]
MSDHVDGIVQQWHRERPHLDVSPMHVMGRLSRVAQQVERRLEENFVRHGLDSGSFDVLATLRRNGSPYTLSPKDLAASAMITSSAVAQRLNRLEDRGLITRVKSSVDGRGTEVTLTQQGRDLVDATLPTHLATEEELLAGLSPAERHALADLLRKFGTGLTG